MRGAEHKGRKEAHHHALRLDALHVPLCHDALRHVAHEDAVGPHLALRVPDVPVRRGRGHHAESLYAHGLSAEGAEGPVAVVGVVDAAIGAGLGEESVSGARWGCPK